MTGKTSSLQQAILIKTCVIREQPWFVGGLYEIRFLF